ncbi:MAG: SDR family oxidoreductase [Actinobacteria bacterium]|nr:SDR family oxidoreductase [Actinomycetota bacterium]
MRDASGRIAVVTGGGRGIGRATALRLAREGHAVVVSSRTQSDLDAVVAQIEADGGRGLAVVADALDRDGARRPVTAAIEAFGGVDVLVNNVGGSVGRDHDPFTMDDDTFERTLTMNLTSAWWTTSAALGGMRDRGWGRIVMIGSGAARSSTPGGRLGYTAGKHGLVGLTRQLAQATARHGITVNCVCPGWTNTSMIDWQAIAARQGVTVEEAQSEALAANAQGRILEPEELTGMISLLVGDDGGGITGQVIGVDGGYAI